MALLRRAFPLLALGVVSSIAAHANAQTQSPVTSAEYIESVVQDAFNQPQNADSKFALEVQLSGGYGTTNIFISAYNFTKAVLPDFNNSAYEDQVQSFAYTLYQSLVQQYYAESPTTDINTLRTNMFNNAVHQISVWVAANPPPGAQWVFMDDGSGITKLVVVAYAGTTFAPNIVIALPDLSGLDVRSAGPFGGWLLDAAISGPNEALFVDALYNF